MSEKLYQQQSPSCPGKSAKRVFAQMTRASTTFAVADKDVDGRDKPGHDGGGRFRRLGRFAQAVAAG